MAGPYATIDRVKKIGGLSEDGDYNLWRFTSPDELDVEVTEAIAMASAKIRERATPVYDAPTAGQLTMITRAECYYALYWLYPALKARKVTGTHYPLDQEDSSRFQELIDIEWKSLAEEALTGIEVISPVGKEFARPTFRIAPVINLEEGTTVESEEQISREIGDRARSLVATP